MKYAGSDSHHSSAVRKNFSAAASSKKPITTLTELSQPPLRGSFRRALGNNASRKNGAANAPENASTQQHLPPAELAGRDDPGEPAQERGHTGEADECERQGHEHGAE